MAIVFLGYTLASHLKAQVPTLSEDVIKTIVDHKIDGEVFLEMNDEHL